jgi:hypothetical protein
MVKDCVTVEPIAPTVPLMTPVEALRLRPVGRPPRLMVQVRPVPPLAWSVVVYNCPPKASARLATVVVFSGDDTNIVTGTTTGGFGGVFGQPLQRKRQRKPSVPGVDLVVK